MRPKAMVLLNTRARGGRGEALWQTVSDRVAAELDPRLVPLDTGWERALDEALADEVSIFVAAGGDGTVNTLVDALVRHRGERPLESLRLGAVGLGSSNDFHKPYKGSLPVRIVPDEGSFRDVGRAQIQTPDGDEVTRHFVVSASAGVTAEGNHFFNTGGGVMGFLRSHATPLAILYTAMRTILRYRNIDARVIADGVARDAAVTNLSILKTPYLSGSFRFDTPVKLDDGMFDVNLCEGMSRWQSLRTLVALSRGLFVGRPRCHHWRARRVEIEPSQPVAFELDGEVMRASRIGIGLLAGKIGTCRP